ncbi:MAG: ABC transporter permease [Actinomycetota bacterium]|jgi:ABC-type dipeptide/oligopeptide/nickel transport system permease subunit|nr:ABC transporter permease [Rubrobacter sp.]MDQ3236037.1 ABC transporter permease [Actinomycetota bacterium]MDQ3638754.1 ABC transporter permease [Actinomycetota bacterium]
MAAFWRRFRRNRPAVFGLAIVVVMLLTAIFAPLIAPQGPREQDYALTLQPPGEGGLFGTDSLGSDIFSRVVYGARISLQASLISVGIAIGVGVPVGLVSGYFRGFLDEWIVMRIVDSIQAFPFLILALVIAAILGGGLTFAMIAIGIAFIPNFVRITRAQVLTVRGLDYVEAARAVGAGHVRIMTRHVLPNSLPPILVQTTLAMGLAIIAEATLSYLGLGAEPGEPSWGSMLFQAQSYLSSAWWMAFFPGMAIFFAVLGFNLLGDGVREALDPRTSE